MCEFKNRNHIFHCLFACLLTKALEKCPLSRAAQGLQYVLVLRVYSVSQWQDRHLLHQADTQGSSECFVPSAVDVQITSTAWTDGLDAIDPIVSVRCVGCSSGRWHPSLLSPSSVATEAIIELQPRCCHVQTRKGCASDMRCAYGVAVSIGGPHSDGRALSAGVGNGDN